MPLTSATSEPALPDLGVPITALYNGVEGVQTWTCSRVAWYAADLRGCTSQYLWNEIATRDVNAIDTFVHIGYDGWFGSMESMPYDSAFAGFEACVALFITTPGDTAAAYAAFHSYIIAAYPALTAADTGPAFEVAQQVLCAQ